MMIFKKAIPRRMFLQGMGAALALPLLDGMVPAFAETTQSPLRLGVVYVGNGMWPMDKWTPKAEGAAFQLTPTLAQLAPYRDQLLVLTGLAQMEAVPKPPEGPQDHSRASGTFLTGVRVKPTPGKDIRAGVSMDQIAAQKLGKDTQLASLEVSTFASDLVGVCETDYSCTYLTTISWRTPTTPNPTVHSPRNLFERLFGDTDSTERTARLSLVRSQKSLLDGVVEAVARLSTGLGPNDRAKLNEYLESVRDIERRIQIAEAQSDRELPSLERPVGVPASFEDYAKLMIDMQVLAYQTDLTRVITFILARESGSGDRAYPEIGITDLHHTLSHHGNDGDKIDKLFQINCYHMKMFAYFMEKMKATREGDGNLLDHAIIMYGAGLSNANIHQHINLPMLLVGGGGGKLKGGRHFRYPAETPMTNLHLAVLDKLGIPLDKLGDSTGKLDLLSM